MLKKISIFFAVVLTAIILTGCPAVLQSKLPSDIMITLGLIRPAEGTASIRTAVGGTISVPVMISDLNRNSAAGSYDVTFTLDADGDLSTTADNVAVATQTITAGSEVVAALEVPAGVTDVNAGTFTSLFASFVAAAGDPGTLIGTEVLNIGVVPINVATAANNLPDLTITFVDPTIVDPALDPPLRTPQFLLPGASFPLTFKITNTGFASVPSGTAIDVDFDVNINGTDIEFGAATVTLTADLLPNDFVTGSAVITMPTLTQMALDEGVAEADVDAWADNLVGTVDPDDAINEVVEGGTDTFGLDSGTQLPDLIVSAIDVPAYSVAGGPVEATITVSNIGSLAAAAGSYGLILFNDVNTDGSYDVGDTVIKTWEAADNPAVPWDVDGNGNNQVVFNGISVDGLVWPAAMTAGDYQIGAVITGGPTEWDSTNNDNTAALHLVAKKVDLEIVSMSTTHTAVIDNAVDTTVPVSITIQNSGSETLTTDFTIEFFISDNATLSNADRSVGTLAVTDDILPGAVGRQTYTFDAALDSATGTTINAGYYTMFAILDSTGAVEEMDEGNNQQLDADDPNTDCSIFLPVDDGAANLAARFLFALPKDGSTSEDNDVDLYLYDSLWTQDSYTYLSNLQSNVRYVDLTLTLGQDHGVATYNNDPTAAFCWRIVPQYVTSIDEQYRPTALTANDSYEDNDTTGTATALSGAVLPFYTWVNNYETGYDYDYYTFTF